MRAVPNTAVMGTLLAALCACGGKPAMQGSGPVAQEAGGAGSAIPAARASAAGQAGVAGQAAAGVGAHSNPALGRAGEGGATAVAGASAGRASAGVPTAGMSGAAGGGTGGMSGVAAASGGVGAPAAGSGGASTGAAGKASAGTQGTQPTYHPCPTDGTPCKIMPFGDSITDGYNADTPGGYRVELFRLAHVAGKNVTFVGSSSNGPNMVDGVAFPHNHEGHSGWTIAPAGGRSGISTLVATVMPQHTPHVVLLMIGTNDAIDNYEMAAAPTRLGQLIDAIYAQLPDVTIVVAQLVPARGDASKGDDAGLNARIRSYNQAIPAVVQMRAAAGKHILTVDMYKPFDGMERALLEDQWHPNANGYVKLGAAWYATVQSLL